MIAPFNFDAPVPLAFGEGRIDKLGRDVTRLAGDGAAVVLVADPFLVEQGGAEQVTRLLADAGHETSLHGDIRSDPLASSIDAIAALARSSGAACVVALGGGSTMDAAKLAASLAPDGMNAEAYALGAQPVPGNGLPKIAIPTTSGTGSEVTRTSVFSTDGRKLWAWGNPLRFDLALLDPVLTTGLPAHLTAATGIDAAVHAMEAATCRRRNPVSTALALAAVRTLREWLQTAVENGDDLEARGHVQIAACIAGTAFDVTGVGAAHAIGHALGEHAGVHHGRAVGLALNATMQDTAAAAPEAYARVAEALGADIRGRAQDEAAMAAVPIFRQWLRDIGLRLDLDDHGLTAADSGPIAALCREPENRVMLEADSFGYTPQTLQAAVERMLPAA